MAGRRGRDEGSIYERSDGRWAATISLGYGTDGKRDRKTVYGRSRKEVADKLRDLQNAADKGLPPTNDAATVAQLFDAWLEEAVVGTVRPLTLKSYRMLARVHIVPALGRHKVSKLDARTVQAFLAAKREEGLSPRTVQYLRSVLRRAFGYAMKIDWVGRNVVALTEAPKVEKEDMPLFSTEQAKRLLAAFAPHRLGGLFTVQLGLGLRLGEALGLRWQDVALSTDGTGGKVTVKVQLQIIDGEYRLTPPKSKSSRRTISLPLFVARALANQRDRQGEAAASWDKEANSWGLAFTTGDGKPLHERNVQRDFRKLLENAGIERLRIHDLRHLCATLLLAQGVHPRVIMEILGHSGIALTMNTYSHVMPAQTEAATSLLDSLLSSE